jgi:hypothetical protein
MPTFAVPFQKTGIILSGRRQLSSLFVIAVAGKYILFQVVAFGGYRSCHGELAYVCGPI